MTGECIWQQRSIRNRHPGFSPGSSAIKSLIAKDSFLTAADTPWLDSGSRPE